ncbi:L-seryl-tRNA selenium transferase [Campylobacter sp. 9BO]|uniref:L-seryl-tRNA selenium transferase n=1 Tax=Campylobacter sp. 9BO TaxID=3424759 RepID=UPI003D3552C8
MKKILLLAVISAFVLAGCNSKREYFDPEKIDGDIRLSKDLPASITHVTNGGATLKNGSVITKDGLENDVKLEKGYFLLNKNEGKVISTNIQGDLKITDTTGAEIFIRSFPAAIVSANIEGNLLATVSATNHIYLIDIYNAITLMEYRSSEISAVDSRVAAPFFLNTIIIYPSLDGKIYIVNKATSQIISDIVVSSENFFNNITFLDVVGDYMFAATAKRVISINPAKTTYFDGEIKDTIVHNNNIFVLQKDGKITKLDFELNKITDKYFKFAIFSDVTAHNDNLYIVEKTGYLIKTDTNLNSAQIFELSGELEDKSFTGKNAFYYDDEYVTFE